MTPVRAMVAVSLAGWLAATAALGVRAAADVGFGILGPLAATTASWVAAERTYRRDPGRLTPLMIGAFGAKLVFFGAYVTAMLAGLSLRRVPFVVSFTGAFVVLYAVEAVYLKRLFDGRLSADVRRPD
jgi:uncharacterized membrane protein YeaQ/YmgE (transglycosylase-associated protein family)